MNEYATTALEDELGDVIEKAMRRAQITPEILSARANVPIAKISEAIDYRPGLSCEELQRMARVLKLNEVGLCAIGSGSYPAPKIGRLPFRVWPLRMRHGIGVANAYLVGDSCSSNSVLFDCGTTLEAMDAVWPKEVKQLAGVFLTHVEAEHTGNLCEVVARFGIDHVYLPREAVAPCGHGIGEGEIRVFGALEVTVFATPGHTAAHNCYLVRSLNDCDKGALLVSGDMIFAGSVGGAYFSHVQLEANLGRVLNRIPPTTIIAPGHGPLTTVENELIFNPFLG